jgi:hypothetical protein
VFTCHTHAGKRSLFAASCKTGAWQFITATPFKAANDASQFVGPVFLNFLLGSISRGDPPGQSYAYAVGMFAGFVLGSVAEAQYWQLTMRAGFRLRAALIAAVYQCARSALALPGCLSALWYIGIGCSTADHDAAAGLLASSALGGGRMPSANPRVFIAPALQEGPRSDGGRARRVRAWLRLQSRHL